MKPKLNVSLGYAKPSTDHVEEVAVRSAANKNIISTHILENGNVLATCTRNGIITLYNSSRQNIQKSIDSLGFDSLFHGESHEYSQNISILFRIKLPDDVLYSKIVPLNAYMILSISEEEEVEIHYVFPSKTGDKSLSPYKSVLISLLFTPTNIVKSNLPLTVLLYGENETMGCIATFYPFPIPFTRMSTEIRDHIGPELRHSPSVCYVSYISFVSIIRSHIQTTKSRQFMGGTVSEDSLNINGVYMGIDTSSSLSQFLLSSFYSTFNDGTTALEKRVTAFTESVSSIIAILTVSTDAQGDEHISVLRDKKGTYGTEVWIGGCVSDIDGGNDSGVLTCFPLHSNAHVVAECCAALNSLCLVVPLSVNSSFLDKRGESSSKTPSRHSKKDKYGQGSRKDVNDSLCNSILPSSPGFSCSSSVVCLFSIILADLMSPVIDRYKSGLPFSTTTSASHSTSPPTADGHHYHSPGSRKSAHSSSSAGSDHSSSGSGRHTSSGASSTAPFSSGSFSALHLPSTFSPPLLFSPTVLPLFLRLFTLSSPSVCGCVSRGIGICGCRDGNVIVCLGIEKRIKREEAELHDERERVGRQLGKQLDRIAKKKDRRKQLSCLMMDIRTDGEEKWDDRKFDDYGLSGPLSTVTGTWKRIGEEDRSRMHSSSFDSHRHDDRYIGQKPGSIHTKLAIPSSESLPSSPISSSTLPSSPSFPTASYSSPSSKSQYWSHSDRGYEEARDVQDGNLQEWDEEEQDRREEEEWIRREMERERKLIEQQKKRAMRGRIASQSMFLMADATSSAQSVFLPSTTGTPFEDRGTSHRPSILQAGGMSTPGLEPSITMTGNSKFRQTGTTHSSEFYKDEEDLDDSSRIIGSSSCTPLTIEMFISAFNIEWRFKLYHRRFSIAPISISLHGGSMFVSLCFPSSMVILTPSLSPPPMSIHLQGMPLEHASEAHSDIFGSESGVSSASRESRDSRSSSIGNRKTRRHSNPISGMSQAIPSKTRSSFVASRSQQASRNHCEIIFSSLLDVRVDMIYAASCTSPAEEMAFSHPLQWFIRSVCNSDYSLRQQSSHEIHNSDGTLVFPSIYESFEACQHARRVPPWSDGMCSVTSLRGSILLLSFSFNSPLFLPPFLLPSSSTNHPSEIHHMKRK
ncbi:hypothetical protein ADUPG1_011253, partial [Aduncisulcus paluster]